RPALPESEPQHRSQFEGETTMQKLTEALDFRSIIAPQDVGTADVTGTYVDVSDAERFVVLAKAGAVTAGKILTVQLMQAQDAAPARAPGPPVHASDAERFGVLARAGAATAGKILAVQLMQAQDAAATGAKVLGAAVTAAGAGGAAPADIEIEKALADLDGA